MEANLGFTFLATANSVQIFRHGTLVTTLKGNSAIRFVTRCADMDENQQQQLMARETGNYKRGNEKASKSKQHNKYR